MKKEKWKWLSGIILFFWCMAAPQMIFVDCIHPVIEDTAKNQEIEEEDYIRMFRLDRSYYKITLKFDIRKWLQHK